METSLRYGVDAKSLRIHAEGKFPVDSNTHLQVNGEFDTGLRKYARFYDIFILILGVGLLYHKDDRLLDRAY